MQARFMFGENAAEIEWIFVCRHNIFKSFHMLTTVTKMYMAEGREAKGVHFQNNKDNVSNRNSSTC